MTARRVAIRHLLIDMDGVLFRGATALPGATEFLPWLTRRGIGFMLLTNNSTLTPVDNARRLQAMRISVDAANILTSSVATAKYLREQGAVGQKAIVIGEAGLVGPLQECGMLLTDDYLEAQWVVIGLDRGVTYAKLRAACLAIEHGARFVAANADSSLPVEEGLIPGAGALQAVVTATTGRIPTVIGKPEPRMLETAMRQLGASPDTTAILGDRLDTDIASAHRAGLPSILVLTGVSTRSDAEHGDIRPDRVVDDLPSLMSSEPLTA